MILALCSDPFLRAAVRRTAHPEEYVFVEAELALRALDQGFPRAVIYAPEEGHPLARRLARLEAGIEAVAITHAVLRTWEAEHRTREVPPSRVEHAAYRLAQLIPRRAEPGSWVDRALADLARAAGAG